ncbi:MAG: hypothetical protein D3903_08135, partial [Candidatus Electrothrix sp. GM3_4]|nr:hypothetical protein [Candidatus Electrothrix sp. GM3_4]
MDTLLRHLLFVTVLLMLAANAAQAATITVDGSTCTLAEAIDSANTDTAFGNGCVDGFGDDTLILQQDELLITALPEITSTITIEGNGYKIDGQDNSAVGTVLRIVSPGNLTLNEATVTGGNCTGDCWTGGGITAGKSTVTLTNSTVSGNTTEYTGGGIFAANDSMVTLTSSTVSGNSASQYGGGVTAGKSTVTLINSTVSGNTASNDGGGIYADYSSTVTLESSTVSGNSASEGGGIMVYESAVTLINSTVSGNTASQYGGGISVSDNGMGYDDATVTLESCLISGNSASQGRERYNDSSTVNADSYNLFGHSGESTAEAFSGFMPGVSDIIAASDGTQPTALYTILSPLADNGGSTETHALPVGSPAIDLDTACSSGQSTDQRGYWRPIGLGCDVGSFEADSFAPIIVDSNGTCTLADAITAANSDAPSGGCPAGRQGMDIIVLKTDITLDVELPEIISPITIEGEGYTIDGNQGDWSVLRIMSGGNLILNKAVVTGGNCTGSCWADGGIYAESATVILNSTTVSGNTANDGGGIYAWSSIVTLTNSTVNDNAASEFGGGISAGESTVTLNNTTVSGNTTNYAGGGIDAYSSTVTLINSTVNGNTASDDGGGVSAWSSTITLRNTTISGNTAGQHGGGISVYDDAIVTLTNSTISDNSASQYGGGIYAWSSTVTLKSCLISGNSASQGREIYNDGGTVNADSYNLFGHSGESTAEAFFDFTPGVSDITASSDGTQPTAQYAIFSPLADNGGPT